MFSKFFIAIFVFCCTFTLASKVLGIETRVREFCQQSKSPSGCELFLLALEVYQGENVDQFYQRVKVAIPISNDQVPEIIDYCQNRVLNSLKTPSVAEFPDTPEVDFVFSGSVIIRGFVDSQNSYGAMLRGSYWCYYISGPKGLFLVEID